MSSNTDAVNFTELILNSGTYDHMDMNDSRRVEYIGALVNGEDVIYLSQEQNLPGSVNSTIFLGCIILLALLCTVFAAGNTFYVLKKRKYLDSPVYPVLVHTFVFTLMLVMVICVEAFTSIITEKSDMHLKRNKVTCFLTNFVKFSIESCNIFQIVMVWLILMSERNLTGLQWLYHDYSLRKILQASADPERVTETAESSSDAATSSILALRHRSFGNFLRLRARQLILYSFYVISFGGAIIVGSQSMVVMFMRNHIVCLPIMNHSPVAEIVRFLIILSLPFFFIPALYLFLLWPTVFGKFFGGARDPLLAQLKEDDIRRLKYVRVISFLKGADALFAFVHSSSSLYLRGSTVELFRIIALLMMLLELVLFTHYEQAFKTIQSSLTTEHGNSGNSSAGFSIPSVARELTANTGERVRNLIFKKTGDNDDTVDYKQLVENEDN